MPEMTFHVRWPDGSTEGCYSPSLVIRDHMAPGESYPLDDFVSRARTALTIASERVEARYGFPCGRALGQLSRIETTARLFAQVADARVAVTAFED